MILFQKIIVSLSLFAFLACGNASGTRAQAEENLSAQEPLAVPTNTVTELTPPAEIAIKKTTENSSASTEKKAPAKSATTMKKMIPSTIEDKPLPAETSPQTTDKPEIEQATSTAVSPLPQAPSHEAWDKLLQKYVNAEGKVNYKGFKEAKVALQQYLDSLTANPVQPSWTKAEKMAYWINAYNAFTIKMIVDNYPTSSIMKLHNGKAWDVKWIKIGDKTYTLNNIENDILRPQFKDARIHFAVNCAAKSCPPILNRAWTPDNLNKFLEQQAKAFINNSKYNKITADAVQVSKIFEWYAGDFNNIIEYLNKYSTTKINTTAKVSYVEYDWALNE